MTTAYFWRVAIGPAYRPASDDHAYDWSVIDEGSTSFDPTAFTTLTSTLADGATTAYTDDASDFPTTGGVFIGPNNPGEAWEYVDHRDRIASTYLQHLIREPSAYREHNGIHTAGATVRPWWIVDTDDGRLRLVEQLDARFGLRTYRFEISGWKMPQVALRNRHLAVVQYRTDPTSSWTVLGCGWIQAPQVADDGSYERRWSGSIVSIARLQSEVVSEPVRAGELDVAPHSAASSSTVLGAAWRESLSGDFVAAEPDFSGQSATVDDGVWIAEQFVGSPNWLWPNADPNAPIDDGGVIITGIFLERPEGYLSEGYRWIELTAYQNSVKDMIIGREYSETDGSFPVLDIGFQNYGEGVKILIVENERIFRSENPTTAAKYVYELADLVFWDNIDPENDSIALWKSTDGGAQSGWTWGASARGSIAHPTKGTYTYGAYSRNTAAPKGYCHRYEFGGVSAPQDGTATTPDAYWRATPILTPGYTIGDYDSDSGDLNESRLERPYLALRLPRLGLTLQDDVSPSAPGDGELLRITDGTDPSTEGLIAPIVIQIGQEQVYCSEKQAEGMIVGTSGRGYNGTTAEDHAAGDRVMVVEELIATDGVPIKTVEWERRSGGVYPVQFDLYVSRRLNPAEPYSEYWESDWTLEETETTHASETWSTDFGATTYRLTAIAFLIKEMSYDPNRPRLDRVKAIVNEQAYNSDNWLTGTVEAGDLVEQLLSNADLPAGTVTVNAGTEEIDGFTTAAEKLWVLIPDFANYAGLRVEVERDSKVTVSADPYYRVASIASGGTLTRVNASRVEIVQSDENTPNQVSLTWRTGDDETTYTEVYPASPDFLGYTLEVGPVICADSTVAARVAQRLYRINRYPYQIIAEVLAGDLDIKAGDVVRIQWQIDDSMQQMDRYMLVENVEHQIQRTVLSTVLSGPQIEREFYA